MNAIETRATIEGGDLLRLEHSIGLPVGGEVRLIMLLDRVDGKTAEDWPPGLLDSLYGSCADMPIEVADDLQFESNRASLE